MHPTLRPPCRLADNRSAGTQTGTPLESAWASFMQLLPREPHPQPIQLASLTDAIVRIYMRQVGAVQRVWSLGIQG